MYSWLFFFPPHSYQTKKAALTFVSAAFVYKSLSKKIDVYFTASTIALKAAGSFIAKSAKALRLSSIPFSFKRCMKRE